MRSPVRVAWRSGTLGVKVDECPRCGQVGRHRLERQYRWLEVGPVGVVPLGLRHGLECASCWAWTPMRWVDLRRAVRTRRLPLPDRPRPAAAAAVSDGLPTPDYDRVYPSASLEGGTVYLGLWVVVVAILVGLAVQPQGVEGEHGSGETCLVVVGLAEGRPLPTPPMIVSPTLCIFPHNFEPLAQVPIAGFGPTATVPPYGVLEPAAMPACRSAFRDAFGQPPPGGPVPVLTGVDPNDWSRGDRFAWCAAADPSRPWLDARLPR